MNIAIIPARAGSKRIIKKNIKQFCGKPMIAWSIEAAKNSACFDHIFVSTDSSEIADIAKIYGAEIPFKRSKELSDDNTVISDVIKNAIELLKLESNDDVNVCCIYATAPFIKKSFLLEGLNILEKNKCDFVLPITTFPFPIQRAIRLSNDNEINYFDHKNSHTRSQDLEVSFHDAGQFIWGKSNSWSHGNGPCIDKTLPVILPRYLVHDIDDPEDWDRAELFFRALGIEGIND
jgi:pseudaminic acid cytidylyltransferase